MKELIEAFARRKINGYFVETAAEAASKALELIPAGSSVGFGGSVTLEQTGVLDILRSKDDVRLLDRTKCVDQASLRALYLEMFSCDVFLSGSNAITLQGQLVNVDGRGNRVAMLAYGPARVIVMAGKNKITPDLVAGIERVRKVACPMNVKRIRELAAVSPVASSIEVTEESIWGQVSVIERQLDPDRMHIIIIGEDLGF